MNSTSPPSAFWAEEGPDSCDFCQVFYYTETGYHCTECDSPICPSCVVTVFESRVVLCPECSSAESAEGEG